MPTAWKGRSLSTFVQLSLGGRTPKTRTSVCTAERLSNPKTALRTLDLISEYSRSRPVMHTAWRSAVAWPRRSGCVCALRRVWLRCQRVLFQTTLLCACVRCGPSGRAQTVGVVGVVGMLCVELLVFAGGVELLTHSTTLFLTDYI